MQTLLQIQEGKMQRLSQQKQLQGFIEKIPFFKTMGIEFDFDEKGCLHSAMRYAPEFIGNPIIPALHGGGTAAFLEAVGIIALIHEVILPRAPKADIIFPKTINITVDYLRAGQPKDSFAQAKIIRAGRRYATMRVKAWQDEPQKPIATANIQFLMPQLDVPAS